MSTIEGLDDLPRPLAFVLSGGAAFGSVQVGMLRALELAGLMPDMVVGASVGAINGVLVAVDRERAPRQLTDIWLRVDRTTVFGAGPSKMVANRVLGRSSALCKPDRLHSLIMEYLPAETFSELSIPFIAVATDAATGETVSLDDGLLIPALLASSAIPGVFPEVVVQGRRLIDGGVSANSPVSQACAAGAASVILLDASTQVSFDEPPNGLVPGVMRSIALLLRAQRREAVAAATAAGVTVVELPNPTPPGLGTLSFDQTHGLIERSFRMTCDSLGINRGGQCEVERWPMTVRRGTSGRSDS